MMSTGTGPLKISALKVSERSQLESPIYAYWIFTTRPNARSTNWRLRIYASF